jgi:hypothetical protein
MAPLLSCFVSRTSCFGLRPALRVDLLGQLLQLGLLGGRLLGGLLLRPLAGEVRRSGLPSGGHGRGQVLGRAGEHADQRAERRLHREVEADEGEEDHHQAAQHRHEHEGRRGVELHVVLGRRAGELLAVLLDREDLPVGLGEVVAALHRAAAADRRHGVVSFTPG